MRSVPKHKWRYGGHCFRLPCLDFFEKYAYQIFWDKTYTMLPMMLITLRENRTKATHELLISCEHGVCGMMQSESTVYKRSSRDNARALLGRFFFYWSYEHWLLTRYHNVKERKCIDTDIDTDINIDKNIEINIERDIDIDRYTGTWYSRHEWSIGIHPKIMWKQFYRGFTQGYQLAVRWCHIDVGIDVVWIERTLKYPHIYIEIM